MGGFFKNEWNDVQSFYPPDDIHNLCGDYTETTIIAISSRKDMGTTLQYILYTYLNIKRND